MKRAGVLTAEPLNRLRRLSRKLGWYPRHSDVWHLLDTVDAQRHVIKRYQDGWRSAVPAWTLGSTLGWTAGRATRELLGYWADGSAQGRSPEEMTLAEQLVIYGKVVRPQAPAWPEDD